MAIFGYGLDGQNGFLFLLFLFSHFLAYGIGNSHDFLGGRGRGRGGGRGREGDQSFVFCENVHTSWKQISFFRCLELLTFLQVFVGIVEELEKN